MRPFLLLFFFVRAAVSGNVLSAAKAELSRSFLELRKQPVPPYFLSYEIIDAQSINVTGSFGTLIHSNENRNRHLLINLRVGDYSLDNTRQVRGNMMSYFGSRFSNINLPIEDDPDAVRAILWYQTDSAYKRAIEQLTTVKTNNQLKVEQEDKSDDFSKEQPEQTIQPPTRIAIDRKVWEEKARKYTAPFQRFGNIYEANAIFAANCETRWFVSSDGSALQTSQTYYRLLIYAFAKADDGMELPRYESFFSFTPEGLPDDTAVLQAVDRMIADLKALKLAPVVDPYTGPAILSGRATGVFFHEVFGHRIEGHRQKSEMEGQTFKKMAGQPVLPEFLSVYFDPTLHRYGGTDLAGSYDYDDEGVKARRVTAVDGGVLKSFLMSRSPIEGFPNSNGHGRAQPGFVPVARQSNLIVMNSKPVSKDRLKAELIEEIKKENKPFGLLFDDIQGGFTITGRTIPNAFNVLPIMVYRVYPDGRQELVRGVDLIGTPLTVFSKIVAADNERTVFNGICGAESGGVPVSAGGPAILVSQIEVQKKTKSQERSPILAPPFDDK
jgi:predicted Zn-dependent protease